MINLIMLKARDMMIGRCDCHVEKGGKEPHKGYKDSPRVDLLSDEVQLGQGNDKLVSK